MALNLFMHPRNRYKDKKPDFAALAGKYPEFRRHVSTTLTGKVSLDFRDPEALRALTCTLLKEDFGIDLEIPLDRIIPTVPLRLNYILWIEDLLRQSGRGESSADVVGIDVGCGASCIYPLLGAKLNGWHFVASEVDASAAGFALRNVKRNNLHNNIQVLEVNSDDMLCRIVSAAPRNLYHFTMCNPPFFGNILEAQGIMTSRSADRPEPSSISTAAECEMIWGEGGEVDFIKRMITDSLQLREQVVWYTSMIGKKASLGPIKQELAKHKICNVTTTEFCQGRTMRWGIGWTFYEDIEPPVLSPMKRFKRDKERPPLVIQVPERALQTVLNEASQGSEVKSGGSDDRAKVKAVAEMVEKLLGTLEIDFKPKPGPKQCIRYALTAVRNTWSNQRRKRRQLLQRQQHQKKKAASTPDAVIARPCSDNTGEDSPKDPNTVGEDVPEKDHSEKYKATCSVKNQTVEDSGESSHEGSLPTPAAEVASCSKTTGLTAERSPVDTQLSCKSDDNSHPEPDTPVVSLRNIENDGENIESADPTRMAEFTETGTDHPSTDHRSKKSLVGQLSPPEGSRQEAEFLFKCVLTVKVADGKVGVEMSWMEGQTRESMHQVGQYLKNQFNRM